MTARGLPIPAGDDPPQRGARGRPAATSNERRARPQGRAGLSWEQQVDKGCVAGHCFGRHCCGDPALRPHRGADRILTVRRGGGGARSSQSSYSSGLPAFRFNPADSPGGRHDVPEPGPRLPAPPPPLPHAQTAAAQASAPIPCSGRPFTSSPAATKAISYPALQSPGPGQGQSRGGTSGAKFKAGGGGAHQDTR